GALQGDPVLPDRIDDAVRERRAIAVDDGGAGLDAVPFESCVGGVEDPNRRFGELGSDAVPGDEGDAVTHGRILGSRYARPVKLQEHHARRLLAAQGLPVPSFRLATSPDEAADATAEFMSEGAERVVIKAQVLVGGRGKAGGVRLAGTLAEAREAAAAILGLSIKGIPVRRVLVAPAARIERELYLSAAIDRSARRILVMASGE